jgi:protein-S-isoprenylcysteine O-methyltransferase Ste14
MAERPRAARRAVKEAPIGTGAVISVEVGAVEGVECQSNLTFSGTKFGGFYFVGQAIAIGAWWLYLAVDSTAREPFLPVGASAAELMAFQLPDLLVALPASLVAGIALVSSRRWAAAPAWACAGAVDYAFLYCLASSLLRQGGWLSVVLMAPAALLSTVSALDASPALISVFRRATPTNPSRHIVATLVQIAIFWSIFLFLLPAAIRLLEQQLQWSAFSVPFQHAVAAAFFIPFSALGLASGVVMAAFGAGTPLPLASPNHLVIAGPYAYVRNPMVIAGLGQGASVGVWLGSWTVLAYVVFGGALWNLFVRPTEERDLVAIFGREFLDYRARVPCWIPRLRPFTSGSPSAEDF